MKQKGIKGRGIVSNDGSRFLTRQSEGVDDGWYKDPEEDASRPATEIFTDTSKTILTRNDSPDIPFNVSINPYKGCEHGCAYCYARPTHAYLDLSPGLDFETRIHAKPDAAKLLRKAFDRPSYRPEVIALGANTDPYQPVERKLKITRQLLEVMQQYRHPVTIVTKSSLIERDIDILADMAQQGLAEVAVSVTSLNKELCRRLEPRATAPQRRLQTIRRLTGQGIPVTVLFAPVIPMLNDNEVESVLTASYDSGARSASYVMLRLPHEVKQLFQEWLQIHYPLKAKRIMNIVRDMRGGKDYDAHFGTRQTGEGNFAELFAQRFQLRCKRLGINKTATVLDTSQFTGESLRDAQLEMF
ncbi:MAG: PA0069 family radical SAM protein [Gammaproteobacteria bacterium]|nr:PA0069 family radical SAM protein [Gammaproteobacteria bacterium]